MKNDLLTQYVIKGLLIKSRNHLLSSNFYFNKMLILSSLKVNIEIAKKKSKKKLTLLTEHYYHHI